MGFLDDLIKNTVDTGKKAFDTVTKKVTETVNSMGSDLGSAIKATLDNTNNPNQGQVLGNMNEEFIDTLEPIEPVNENNINKEQELANKINETTDIINAAYDKDTTNNDNATTLVDSLNYLIDATNNIGTLTNNEVGKIINDQVKRPSKENANDNLALIFQQELDKFKKSLKGE